MALVGRGLALAAITGRQRIGVRLGCIGLIVLLPVTAFANATSRELAAAATDQLYNLDLERALAGFRAAVAADPTDAAAHRGLASALWAQTAYLRGTMTVDTFLGRVGNSQAKTKPPPAEIAGQFREAVDRAMALAQARVDRQPDDIDAIFEFGASVGLRASYIATVDGSIVGAFRAAKAAFDAHERVLAMDAGRRDAGLIVGTYRYMVATLSRPVRWMAYVAGFGGDSAKGLRLVEGAAHYESANQADARLALVLLYNRERRYDDALAQLATLRDRYPNNRLLWLEAGSTMIRASRAADAERMLTDGLTRFAADTRAKMFGEEALWSYKRGLARAIQGHDREADADLRKAIAAEGRDWVHGRAQLELGKLALKAGNRVAARSALEQAILLCERDFDGYTAEQARRLLPRDRR